MLTKTSETAIQALLYLVVSKTDNPMPPAQIAEKLGASPSYLAKICTLLVKADLLRAARGVKGGVVFSRPPEQITLLEIVEACQGKILGDYCQEYGHPEQVCGFHQAMADLHEQIVGTLRRWTLGAMAVQPQPVPELRPLVHCRMACACSELKDA